MSLSQRDARNNEAHRVIRKNRTKNRRHDYIFPDVSCLRIEFFIGKLMC